MASRKINLSGRTEQAVEDLATKRNIDVDQLLTEFIQHGLWRAQSRARWTIGLFLAACLTTAILVVVFLWLLSFPAPLVPKPGATFYDLLLPTLHWLRVFFFTMVPWPLTIIILAWIFFRSGSAFALMLGIMGLLRKVKLFGAEIELNEQTKRKIQTAASEISAAIQEYKKRMDAEVARVASRYQLDRLLAQFVDDAKMLKFTSNRKGKFRCTVHIPDPVRDGHLYQLLDYYPQGGGSFRSYSERYGIIGKVWRSEERQLEPNLLKDISASTTHEQKISRIMQDWGMTKREAESAIKKPSYFCFLLTHEGAKVGLVYMDSEEQNAFDASHSEDVKSPADEVTTLANGALAKAVSKLLDDLAALTLKIELRD